MLRTEWYSTVAPGPSGLCNLQLDLGEVHNLAPTNDGRRQLADYHNSAQRIEETHDDFRFAFIATS